METTNAILLRKRKLSDTSLIVCWYTDSSGRLETVARGARRLKSPLAGKLDLFFELEIQFKRSRKSTLHTLTEAALRQSFGGIRNSFLRTQTASYFVELIEISTEPEHSAPELFDLLRRAFGFLDAHEPSLREVRYFEAELARLSGIHSAQQDPAIALGALFGRLPKGRGRLLQALAERQNDSPAAPD